jgi:hypothetical protein
MRPKKRTIVAASTGVALLAVVLSCLPELTLEHIGPACGNGLIEYDAGEECEVNGSTNDPACVDCKVVCSGYKNPGSLHCYYSPSQRANTVLAAQGACRGGSALVHLGSGAEHQALVDNLVVDGGTLGPFYVALQEVTGEKIQARWEPLVAGVSGWGPTCPACYAGGILLTKGHPDGGATAECGCSQQCAAASGVGPLVPVGCRLDAGQSLRVVCERTPPGRHVAECDAGTCIAITSTHAQKRYTLVRRVVPASEVAAACAAIGASAATFETQAEREEIAQAITELGSDTFTFWIGLEKRGGGWVWQDGVVESDFNAHAPVFASSLEVNEAKEGDRALITVTTGQPLLDNGLAHPQPPNVVAGVLCQFRL